MSRYALSSAVPHSPTQLPPIVYPPELPVSQRKDEIARTIEGNQVVVLCGETGSGKTTQLPKICLEHGIAGDRLIGHTQPRRIAARTVASRIAHELKAPLGPGGIVGTKIRFDDRTGRNTRIKLMTDGILLAETRSDRKLNQYGCIIIDEAHERSLNIDFLLGYLRQLLPRRPDLRLIITSATIDTERFAEHFGRRGTPAPIIEVSGRTYPVEMRYLPPPPDDDGYDPHAQLTLALTEIIASGPGDALVFQPGEREIRQATKAIRERFAHVHDLEILPLYARLSHADQQRVFRPHTGRRVVLATNVAETSLTVPGIRFVIDPGTARISRYSARSRVQGLPVEPISQASANQRAGRCGRLGPGVCYRLYSQDDFEDRDAFTPPEILRTNLAAVVLRMADLKLGNPEEFPFIEPPGGAHIRDGYKTLDELGALDDTGRLTDIGRKLARFPIDPRIGRMILAAHHEECMHDVLVIAAGLSAQDPRDRPHEHRDAADAAHERFAHPGSDFLSLLTIWDFYHEQRANLSRSKLDKAMRHNFLSNRRIGEWREVYRQLRRQVVAMGLDPEHGHGQPDAVHRALLTGLGTHIGRKGEAFEYEGPGGRKFSIHPGSGQFSKKPKWLMAGELVRTTKLYARMVARVDPKWIEDALGHLLKRTHTDPLWDRRSGRVLANERVTLYGLEIVAKRRVHFGPIDAPASREIFIHSALVARELDNPPDVVLANWDLCDRVAALEDKARRSDLLADAQARFAFYDARLPRDVFAARALTRWLNRARRDDPAVLRMTEPDLLAGDASGVTADLYPDRYETLGAPLELEYAFAVGDEHDGVSLRVPAGLLARLRPEHMDRLVPGLLRHKITALMRTLPKSIRRQFDADRVAIELAPVLATGSRALVQDLASALNERSQSRVRPEDFRLEALDQHLRMRFIVVDDTGRELAAGRDLPELRAQFASEQSPELGIAHDEYNRDDLSEWDFGDLPASLELTRAGAAMTAYPALIDLGRTAGLRLFDTRESAAASMRTGLARLFVRYLHDEFRYHADHLPGIGTLRLLYAPLGPVDEFERDLMLAIADRALIGNDTDVRTQGAFTTRVESGWNRIGPAALEIGTLAEQVLSMRQRLVTRLDHALPAAWNPAVRDMRAQLARLVCARFLATTPDRWLRCMPRYLKAIDRRLDKLRSPGPARDAENLRKVSRWWVRYDQRAQQHQSQGIADPALDDIRWMIEELRVSYFAQELGTSIKVSPTRLEKAWDQVRV